MSNENRGWGGKRAGSGRKSRAVHRRLLSVRVEDDVYDKFSRVCEARGVSYSKLFEGWVKRLRE